MSSDDGYDPFTAPVTTQHLATALLGPFMAGWVAHFLLGGVVVTRYISYIQTSLYRTDPRSTQLLLHVIVLLDLGSLGVHGEQLFYYGTSQDRSFSAVYLTRPVDMVVLFLIGVSWVLVSSFFCRRAAGLFNSNLTYQTLFLWLFHVVMVVAFAFQLASFVLLVTDNFTAPLSVNAGTGIFMWLSSATDWSLTVSLFLLLRRRFDGQLDSVREVLSLSVRTASFTSICTLLGAVTAIAWPATDYSTANILGAFQGPLPSLYALSIIVTLASRKERTAVVVGSTRAGVATADFSASKLSQAMRSQHSAGREDDDGDGDDSDDEGGDEDAFDEEKRAHRQNVGPLPRGSSHGRREIELGEPNEEADAAFAAAARSQGRRVSRVSFADEVL